tara:strand:- start:1305 stop:1652 length:348 start_codon:yes stop_codon:yes gene_type:complete
MSREEIIEIFNTNELDNYSRWNVGNGVQHVLPPLILDKKLRMLKINGDNYSRIDFMLTEFNGFIFFLDLFSEGQYGFDIDDISQDKIYFRLDGSKGVVWTRLSIGTIDDLLSYFQ